MEDLDEIEFQKFSRYLKRFANPKRLRIFFLLIEKGEMCVTELVVSTGISQSRLSAHLTYLRRCRDIKVRKRDNFVYYSIADERLAEFLTLGRNLWGCNCCGAKDNVCVRVDSGE